MPEVVFIADDFGLSEAVNRAVVRTYLDGALHGASLMMGQPGSADAVALAGLHPGLAIGWHLHLCDSTPVTRTSWPWGRSPLRTGFALGFRPGARRLAQREIQAQWHQFQATGLPCHFVNAHHHLHVHPFVLRELDRTLGPDFTGWMRGLAVRRFPTAPPSAARTARWLSPFLHARLRKARQGRVSDHLWGLDRTFAMDADEIRSVLATPAPGFHEFVFHPRAETGDRDTAALVGLRAYRGRGGRWT